MVQTKKHIDIPAEFCFQDRMVYPTGNDVDFEYWLSKNYKDEENNSDRIFLPFTLTAYHKLFGFGTSQSSLQQLQNFVNKLDKSLKYWCVIQYDSGTLIDWTDIDIRIYSMSGGAEMNYPLPLIAQPYPKQPDVEKRYLANFIGRPTHAIRNKMIWGLMNKSVYYISTNDHDVDRYTKIISQSTFTLCPRGFGLNSFRIAECLQQQSIPVYISDSFVFAHNVPFDYYGVVIKEKDVNNIDEILREIPESEIKRRQNVLKDVYESLYTYEGTKYLILEDLNNAVD